VEKESRGLVLTGESFFQQSVSFATQSLERKGFPVAESRVKLLPDTLAGAKNYGVMNVSKVMARFKPVTEKFAATELIYGDAVRIIREDGEYLQVQSPEGYLCYIPASTLVRMHQPEWSRHHQGPFAIFLSPIPLNDDVRINRGSRLPLVGEGTVLLADGSELAVADSTFTIADPAANPKREAIIDAAKGFLGLPYVWGGRSDEGLDCSGLVLQCMGMNGVFLPRDSDEMANVGRLIALPGWKSAILPGDIVFFTGRKRLVTHTGIYMGNDLIIHSHNGGTEIQSWDPASPDYNPTLNENFVFARRVFD
jgi:hypothetical protein